MTRANHADDLAERIATAENYQRPGFSSAASAGIGPSTAQTLGVLANLEAVLSI